MESTIPVTLTEEDEDGEEQVGEVFKEQVNIKELVKYYYQCNSYEWKKISDLIMHSFWATNTPYCADIPMVVLNEEGRKHLEEQKVFDVGICDTHSVTRMGQRFLYHYKKNCEKIFFSMAYLQNKRIQKYIWLPNPVCQSEVWKSSEKQKQFYKIVLSEKAEALMAALELEAEEKTEQKIIFQGRFFMYMLSYVLLGDYIQTAKLPEDMYQIDHTNLIFSFGKRFVDYFSSELWKEEYREKIYALLAEPEEAGATAAESGIEKQLSEELANAVLNTNELYKGYEKNLGDKAKHCAHIFSRYYKMNGNLDEKKAYIDRVRMAGIPIKRLITQMVELTQYPVKDVVTAFLNQYYLGYSTLSYRVINGIPDCYSHAGEQSYKCVVHEFVVPVYFLYRYEQLFYKTLVSKLREVYLSKAEDIYKKYDIPFKKTNFNTYSNGAMENIYDEITIREHCNESENKNVDKSNSELVALGYQLEAFVRATAGISKDSWKEICEKFDAYCAEK